MARAVLAHPFSLQTDRAFKMKNLIFIGMLLAVPALFAQWDIAEKQMGTFYAEPAWQEYAGGNANAILTQSSDYVNFRKTANGQSGYWAWLRQTEPFDALQPGTPYSIEVKARLHSIDMPDDGNGYEANQISLRMKSENLYAPIYLKYGDASTGYVSTTSGGEEPYYLNTSEYQVYRLVLLPDHKTYDVYVEGVDEPIFEDVAVGEHADENGVYVVKARGINEFAIMGAGQYKDEITMTYYFRPPQDGSLGMDPGATAPLPPAGNVDLGPIIGSVVGVVGGVAIIVVVVILVKRNKKKKAAAAAAENGEGDISPDDGSEA